MNYDKAWNIGLNALSGAAIFFVLLLIPPYLTAFTNESNDVIPELKAQEVNPWIDEPIEELNDLTLRQVFEDAQLILNGGPDFVNTNDWFVTNGVLSIENGNLILNSQGTLTFSRANSSFSGDLNDSYYVNSRLRVLSSNVTQIRVHDGYTLGRLSNPIQNQWYNISYVRPDIRLSTLFIDIFFSTSNNLNYITEIDYVLVLNLSLLGIDNLTTQQMDYYYGRYLRYKDSTINDYTTVFNNYLSLAPDSNPLEIVKPIEYYMDIILDTYDTISNFWNNVSNLFVVDILQENAFEIYDKWWFKPFQWLIGD